MDAKTKRKHLNDFTDAHTQIELAEEAIRTLERMDGGAALLRLIASLRREQQRALSRMDAAAAKLGAPYGA